MPGIQRRSFLVQSARLVAAGALAGRTTAAGAKPRTVLLKSGWQTINIGDIGHTPGTLRIFERYLPEVQVIVWQQASNEAIERMIGRRFPRVRLVRGRLAADGPQGADLERAFAEADLFVQNSSMGTSIDTQAYCRRIGKPYGFYGQSYFPEFVRATPQLWEVLSAAAFVYCRDSETLAALRQANIRCPVLEFAPDGCFGIDVRDDEKADAFLRRHHLEPKRFITVMLRTNTPKHPTKDDPLNPQHPTAEQKADDQRRAAMFRELIATWTRQTGMKVLLAPEVDKEIAHNRRLLYDPLPEEVKRFVIPRDSFWNVDEAASVFARARVVVCHEPHSCIIGLAMGTPILHPRSLFHGPKGWMFKDIGLEEWLFDIDAVPAQAIIDALLAIHADYPAALGKVREAMAFVESRQAATMEVVRRALG
jgi:polysaccharide pyruvyl transferase WcaK-like protein